MTRASGDTTPARWPALTRADVLLRLDSRREGLPRGEAARRRESRGANELATPRERGRLAFFAEQFVKAIQDEK